MRQAIPEAPSIIGAKGHGKRPEFVLLERAEDQEAVVLRLVQHLISKGAKPSDICVMAPLKALVTSVEGTLLDAGPGLNALYRVQPRQLFKPLFGLMRSVEKLAAKVGRGPAAFRTHEITAKTRKMLGKHFPLDDISNGSMDDCVRKLKLAMQAPRLQTRYSL